MSAATLKRDINRTNTTLKEQQGGQLPTQLATAQSGSHVNNASHMPQMPHRNSGKH